MRYKRIITAGLLILLISALSAQFGKNKVQVDKIDWAVIQTLHFDIYYPKGADEFGKKAALMSEEAYYYLQEAFQVPLYKRVPLIFYESHREFQVTNIIYPLLMEGVGGFTESLRNRVVVPYDGSYKKFEETLIHELTHAYVNAMDDEMQSSRFFNIQRMPFPFWFSEGLPEYLAIGGEDNYNNMFVMDMVFNANLHSLERVGGYYAYRLGESFLTYIDEQYGWNAVMQLFFSAKSSGSMDIASQRVFGMSFEDIQKRWRNHLYRTYTPYLNSHEIPYEAYERRTNHKEQGSFFNFSPRFAPDGNSYLYFSNRDQRMSIWRGLTIDIFEDRLILRGETTGKFEQFHFQRSNISWFPDSRHFAFIAKTKAGDVLYVTDVQTGKITDSYKKFDFDAIYEIDICRNGQKIVFSGQKGMTNNIYYMDLESGEITAVTNDAYYDHQPRWSPDGSKIVFSSERGLRPQAKYDHLFSRLTDQIYYYDLDQQEFYQVTDDAYGNHSPFWDSTGDRILFVSEEDNITNFHIIDLTAGSRAVVTKTLTGVFKGDVNYDDTMLIFSVFYENGWNLYKHRNPLSGLDYFSYREPRKIELEDDFFQRFDLDRYRYYGRDDDLFTDSDDETVIERHNNAFFRVRRNITLHPKPDEINEPIIKPHRVRFFLDRLWGGAAYSSTYGSIVNLQLGLSDIMGDHTIGLQLGITESLKNSDFVINYLHLPRRIDYGIGAFYLNDDYITRTPDGVFYNVLTRDTGLFSLIRYPFNRFWRLDIENVIYDNKVSIDRWVRRADGTGVWQDYDEFRGLVYSPEIKFVHDNILYGPTGPMTGWRGLTAAAHSFSEEYDDYYTLRTDLRHYKLFAKNYSFATRLQLGHTNAEGQRNKFRIDGSRGVRGLTDPDIRGKNKVVGSMELRFPFIDRLDMQFPLPMTLSHVRGSIFTDIGAVWDENSQFRGMKNGALNDIKLGIGMGPRFNLGYFVLKLDTTWTTDLSSASRPTYFWSINEEF